MEMEEEERCQRNSCVCVCHVGLLGFSGLGKLVLKEIAVFVFETNLNLLGLYQILSCRYHSTNCLGFFKKIKSLWDLS